MEPKFTKYKKLIELQLEKLTAANELGQSAQKTVELDQQCPRSPYISTLSAVSTNGFK